MASSSPSSPPRPPTQVLRERLNVNLAHAAQPPSPPFSPFDSTTTNPFVQLKPATGHHPTHVAFHSPPAFYRTDSPSVPELVPPFARNISISQVPPQVQSSIMQDLLRHDRTRTVTGLLQQPIRSTARQHTSHSPLDSIADPVTLVEAQQRRPQAPPHGLQPVPGTLHATNADATDVQVRLRARLQLWPPRSLGAICRQVHQEGLPYP